MYINRSAEEIFRLAVLAAAIQFFDNFIEKTIKEIAEQFSVSEKQLHFWKNLLIEKGPKIYSSLKPGRRKENLSSHSEAERVLAAETVNHIVVGRKESEVLT
jgi:transposase-like protein